MNDTEIHVRLSTEKMRAAFDVYSKKRYTVVGDLTIKGVEQAIEAAASLEGKHFHIHPRSAHVERTRWAKEKFPRISKDLDELWGAYGSLSYEGIDGQRAKKALESMERVVGEITRNTNLRFA